MMMQEGGGRGDLKGRELTGRFPLAYAHWYAASPFADAGYPKDRRNDRCRAPNDRRDVALHAELVKQGLLRHPPLAHHRAALRKDD